MTIRSFIFCDICNPQGFRTIEKRRNTTRKSSPGRRISDGRSWIEGTVDEALSLGWIIDAQERHVCERCAARALHDK